MTDVHTMAKSPFRADHVGSFLRPQILQDAKRQYQEGNVSKAELRAIEDAEITKLVEKQKSVGLTAVTDGEFRREFWHLDFIQSLEGIRVYDVEASGRFQGLMKKLTVFTIDGTLKFPKTHPFIEDFKYLNSIAGEHIAKLTIPGPNMIFHSEVINNDTYLKNPSLSTLDAAAENIINVYQETIQALYDAGCRYLQLDDPSWGALFSDDFREDIQKTGFDPDELIQKFADLTIKVVENKPADMVITLHVCRGNYKSTWMYQGGYEPVAEQLFSRVNVDAFFLEFDSERAGDFSPLRFVKDQKVVLGLITTKTPELEDKEIIKQRIEEATKYVDLNQLCISPQCGFASAAIGNNITEQDQWDKLELVVDIADEVWNA